MTNDPAADPVAELENAAWALAAVIATCRDAAARLYDHVRLTPRADNRHADRPSPGEFENLDPSGRGCAVGMNSPCQS